MNFLKTIYNYAFNESNDTTEEAIEEIIQTKPKKDAKSDTYLLSVDGTRTDLESDAYSTYVTTYFPSRPPTKVSFGEDSNLCVVYDSFITQPPELFNKKATSQTNIDIYGDALIIKGIGKASRRKKKRKKKCETTMVRRKSSRLAAKNKK